MGLTSNTGLMESLRKPIEVKSKEPVELTCLTSPAPFILRPFAGLYNPFSYGCSILCNHPADAEIKYVVKRAKDALATETKPDALAEEMATLRASLQQTEKQAAIASGVDYVPEELFRRYTETDSRPLTPAPTLASAVSRSSLRRRCLTPDQPAAPRKTLVLDLRRSHSQETLCWHGFHTSELSSGIAVSSLGASVTTPAQAPSKPSDKSNNQVPPLVSPMTLARRSPHPRGNLSDRSQKSRNQLRVLQSKNPPPKIFSSAPNVEKSESNVEFAMDARECGEEGEGDADLMGMGGGEIRRRGRRRKGRNRLMSAALIASAQSDPETQVAGIGSDSHNPSSRGSVAQNDDVESEVINALNKIRPSNVEHDSFLEPDILKHLQRQVDHMAIESEYDPKRRFVLEEALRTKPDKVPGIEMTAVIKEFKLHPIKLDKILHIPRVFSRRNATFSLPIDYMQLEDLTPMQYISEYIKVSSPKQLLYQTVLEKFHSNSFYMPLDAIKEALQVMMGESLNDEKAESFKSLIKWDLLTTDEMKSMATNGSLITNLNNTIDESEEIEIVNENLFAEFDIVSNEEEEEEPEEIGLHFRVWCGLCALCERLNAQLPSLKSDPPHEIEVADFDMLPGRLMILKLDEDLAHILDAIQSTHLQ